MLVHGGLALDLDVGSCPFALGFSFRGDFPVLKADSHCAFLHCSLHSFSSLRLLQVVLGLHWCGHRYHLLIDVLVNLLSLSESPDGGRRHGNWGNWLSCRLVALNHGKHVDFLNGIHILMVVFR